MARKTTKKLEEPIEGDESPVEETTVAPVVAVAPWEKINTDGVRCDLKGVVPGSRSYKMAEVLSSQPKVSTFLPLEGAEKPGITTASVILNGFRVEVLKGRYVNLPQQIHETLAESYSQTVKATTQPMTFNPMTGEKVNANLGMRSEGDKRQLNA